MLSYKNIDILLMRGGSLIKRLLDCLNLLEIQQEEQSPAADGSGPEIFNCPECNQTYIAIEKTVCSQCGCEELETVPNERDLGLV